MLTFQTDVSCTLPSCIVPLAQISLEALHFVLCVALLRRASSTSQPHTVPARALYFWSLVHLLGGYPRCPLVSDMHSLPAVDGACIPQPPIRWGSALVHPLATPCATVASTLHPFAHVCSASPCCYISRWAGIIDTVVLSISGSTPG